MADPDPRKQGPPAPSDVPPAPDDVPEAPTGTTRSPEKDPSEWVTGDEPMTGPQASYLKTLSQEAGEAFDETLSKAQASEKIDALQAKTGRGRRS